MLDEFSLIERIFVSNPRTAAVAQRSYPSSLIAPKTTSSTVCSVAVEYRTTCSVPFSVSLPRSTRAIRNNVTRHTAVRFVPPANLSEEHWWLNQSPLFATLPLSCDPDLTYLVECTFSVHLSPAVQRKRRMTTNNHRLDVALLDDAFYSVYRRTVLKVPKYITWVRPTFHNVVPHSGTETGYIPPSLNKPFGPDHFPS